MRSFAIKILAPISPLAFVLLFFSACQTKTPVRTEVSVPPVKSEVQSSPKTSNPDFVTLDHKYFVVFYDKSYRLARYVEYTLTADQLKKSIPGVRKNKFRADPMLTEFKVFPKEYNKTGYDKGHLANSQDFSFSAEANAETFVMSNMTPQTPNLNRDAWLKLENQVRKWACGEETVTVITGPILKRDLKTFKCGLPIPEKFFKIVLDETPPKKMLAFIYNQTDKGDLINQREVTMANLEKEVLPQISDTEKTDFSKYPIEPIASWKSTDCFTKKHK